jgi:type IV secretion system protein VirD4
MCLIVQNLPQLDSIYGEDIRNSMCGNCDYKAVLKATDGVTQKYFSELVGTYERKRIGKGKNWQALNPFSGSSESEIVEEKKIIRPEEFSTLPDIVLLTTHKYHTEHSGFYRIQRKPYYEDLNYRY